MADFDKTIYTQKASEKLLNHLQNNDFLLEVKKAIDDKPTEYKEIIQSHIENIPPVGKVMTLAVLREWKAAKTIEELRENENWKIVTESPKSSSDGKKQKAAKVLQRNIRKFAHKNETSKLQRKQKQKRLAVTGGPPTSTRQCCDSKIFSGQLHFKTSLSYRFSFRS